jgi:DNA-directed RNA polymerase subunit RPC12/RpoP
MTICFTTRRHYTRSGGIRHTSEGFVCLYCRNIVSAEQALTGGHNRNHCPYCLSSRHLDLYQAGDRLSACRGHMQAIGLTLKHRPSKYATEKQGELMLIHQCEECGKVSINRIAADDDDEAILSVFERSQWIDSGTHAILIENGIFLLDAEETPLVYRRLYGQAASREKLRCLN